MVTKSRQKAVSRAKKYIAAGNNAKDFRVEGNSVQEKANFLARTFSADKQAHFLREG